MSDRLTARVLIRKEGDASRSMPAAFGGSAIIGALGGLIGLGGAEFRLPLLIGAFRFAALQAVILNKAMSLVVVASALPFRGAAVPFASVAAHWPIIVNLLAGSLLGAWFGEAGLRASRRTHSIASLPFCFLGSRLCWCLGTMRRPQEPC
jgi:uncharacterized membrane protein YfcA